MEALDLSLASSSKNMDLTQAKPAGYSTTTTYI